jgi:flotillin
MFFYRIPAPDEAMLISGGKGSGGAPFRVVTGHGAFVLPPFRKARFLTLATKKANVVEPCFTNEKFEILVKSVIVFHVPGQDEASIVAAGQRFVREENEMEKVTGEIFAGHLRSICGALTLHQLMTERQSFEEQVLESSKIEMARIGLEVDSLKIQTLDDQGRGYIAALSAPHSAALQREAKIAQAEADRAAAEAQQESARKQAEYARETTVKQAEYKAEMDRAEAQAAQAGPLAEAQYQQEVLHTRSQLAQRAAALREQELQTEVVKPAEAEAQRVAINAEAQARATAIDSEAQARQNKVLAEGNAEAAAANARATRASGDAEAAKLQAIKLAEAAGQSALADAAAAHGKVSLDQLLIENLPAIVGAATSGLANSRLTVLNGADGVNAILSGAVQQGLSIFETLRENITDRAKDESFQLNSKEGIMR